LLKPKLFCAAGNSRSSSRSKNPALYAAHKNPAFSSGRKSPGFYATPKNPIFYEGRMNPAFYEALRNRAFFTGRKSPGFNATRKSPASFAGRKNPAVYEAPRNPGYSVGRKSPAFYAARKNRWVEVRGHIKGNDHQIVGVLPCPALLKAMDECQMTGRGSTITCGDVEPNPGPQSGDEYDSWSDPEERIAVLSGDFCGWDGQEDTFYISENILIVRTTLRPPIGANALEPQSVLRKPEANGHPAVRAQRNAEHVRERNNFFFFTAATRPEICLACCPQASHFRVPQFGCRLNMSKHVPMVPAETVHHAKNPIERDTGMQTRS
jgi:hypothetical protein